MTTRPKRQKTNPELKRRKNMAAFWNTRYEQAAASGGTSALAAVAFDRARAAALRAEDNGHPESMYALAQMLSEWAERMERAEPQRHAS